MLQYPYCASLHVLLFGGSIAYPDLHAPSSVPNDAGHDDPDGASVIWIDRRACFACDGQIELLHAPDLHASLGFAICVDAIHRTPLQPIRLITTA